MSELSTSEYEALLQISQAALGAHGPEDWWVAVSDLVLGPLFHADVFSLADIDYRKLTGQFGLIRPDWAEASVPTGSEMHRDLLADHPFTAHLAGPAGQQIVRVTDLVSPLAWRQMAGHAKMRELISATNQLSIPVTLSPVRSLSLSPIRAGSDFTDHEMYLARRLQPLLRAADCHVRHMLSQRAIIQPGQRAAAAGYHLTTREQVVLSIMATGKSTAGIARQLAVSPRTISKHQENIYRKLGVTDRLAAILLARHAGLITAATIKPAGPAAAPNPTLSRLK